VSALACSSARRARRWTQHNLSIGGARAVLGMLEIPMSQKGYKERSQLRRSLFSCQHGIVWTGEEPVIFSSAFRDEKAPHGVNEVRLKRGMIVREGLRRTLSDLRLRKQYRSSRERRFALCIAERITSRCRATIYSGD